MATLVAPLLLAAGCSDGGGTDGPEGGGLTFVEHDGVPVLEGALKGPGSLLGDGVRVAPGTALIGTVFPGFDGAPVTDDPGWRAWLLATGEASAILADYRRQAIALGLARPSDASGPACERREGGMVCYVEHSAGSPGDGRSLKVTLHRRPASRDQPAISHVVVRYQERGRGGGEPSTTTSTPTTLPPDFRVDDPAEFDLPAEWRPLAKPGDELRGGMVSFADLVVTVESGSTLSAPLGVTEDYVFETFAGVLRVTEDPKEVAAAYGRQFDPLGDRPRVAVQSVTVDGRVVHSVEDSAAGAAYLEAHVVARRGQPSWMLIETCYD